ncbi:MAG: NADH-quinone oxidoreductase subunit L [Desulfobacterales bacterium]|nr:NADH-quinone oxidoreductase subunit L [Desulfobacterales bacterium]
MKELLVFILIVSPFMFAVLCSIIKSDKIRSFVVLAMGIILSVSSLLLITKVPFSFSPKSVFTIKVNHIIEVSDFLLLFLMLFFAFKYKSILIRIFVIFQMVFVSYFDFFLKQNHSDYPTIYCDHLSLIMVLIISIIGSLICFQAVPYMKEHEHHLNIHPAISKQRGFFFVMVLFLGAMNGLALSNDMMFFYFFFEVTTICSFLLIGHDQTEVAIKNSIRALWMNSLGGCAFIVAIVWIYSQIGTLDIQEIIRTYGNAKYYVLPLALICLAGFTKSAQFPFQSWLLGAMVAPTPVSALLHSSTMVKVGVYIVLRFSPVFKGIFLSQCVALCGAFAFLAGAALAVGQSNGKKVLAYSTISNLGLILACAGINTPAAHTAAILLIIFHAVTKALLFMCVGTIEQHIASRDIEDMRGLYAEMPITALITVMGVITMIMPPFGLLLGKWMAMEAAARNLLVILMVSLGSALTVMYWARWAGTLMSDPFAGKFKLESQPILTWIPLLSLCSLASVLSFLAPLVYTKMIVPDLNSNFIPFDIHRGIFENSYGQFPVVPLCLIAILGFGVAVWAVKSAASSRIVPPYLSGAQTAEPGTFTGPMNQLVKSEARNYYLSRIFGEKRLTTCINLAAGVWLILMVGGTL